MTRSATNSVSASGDLALAELVEQLTTLLAAGDEPAVEALLQNHPEHAQRLRAILPTLEMLSDLNASRERAASPAEQQGGVLGDYRIGREIGRGGMGVVYEAEQLSLRRRVALKMLPLAGMLDERALLRFRNEAQAAAGLHHPHIVPIYGVGCERGVHYYAMQFIDGLSLDRWISAMREEPPHDAASETEPLALMSTEHDSPTPVDRFRRIAELGIQVAEALHYAHELSVIHRDIKPGNLLMEKRGQVWVADFGLAQMEGEANLTLSGDMLGTLRYMSPEQAGGNRLGIDHRTDIYSLGATLYELLALRPAVVGENREELLRQITQDDPLPLKKHNAGIPVDLETIVLKSLEKELADRYATAADFAADLRRFLKGQTILARRPASRVRTVPKTYSDKPEHLARMTPIGSTT